MKKSPLSISNHMSLSPEEIAHLLLQEIERRCGDRALFSRGKQYALSGAVHHVRLQHGCISCQVRDRKYIYNSSLTVEIPAEWEQFFARLRQTPVLAQQWQEHEVSHDLLTLCKEYGIPLLPSAPIHPTCDCSEPTAHHWCSHAIACLFFIANAISNNILNVYDITSLPPMSYVQQPELANFWHWTAPTKPQPYPAEILSNWSFIESVVPYMVDCGISPAMMKVFENFLRIKSAREK